MTDWRDRIARQMPDFALPNVSQTASITVYMIHTDHDPEAYFFLFDFEEFVERSQNGLFVRPALKIYSGRDDFSRVTFAKHFREVFAGEFDRMRAELAAEKKKGWLTWNFGIGSAIDLVGGLVGNLVLAIALRLSGRLLPSLSLPGFLKGKSDETRLSDEISKIKSNVEDALMQIDVKLHPELYEHAYRDGPRGKMAGMDRSVWPLPAHVRTHMEDKHSGSWW